MRKEEILFPEEEILDGKYFNTHQDWEVPIPGFFIIASKREVFSIEEFSDEEYTEFTKTVRRVRRGMKEVLGIKTVYFFQNEDASSGFHPWLFPRYAWMDKFGKKIESVRPIMEYATKDMNTPVVASEVKEAVAKMKKYLNQ